MLNIRKKPALRNILLEAPFLFKKNPRKTRSAENPVPWGIPKLIPFLKSSM
jgi:hypothetical protein